MATDILSLLRRDHQDLDHDLAALLDATASIGQIRIALDGVRLGLTAHAEAEDIVFHASLAHCRAARALELVVDEASQAHQARDRVIGPLDPCLSPTHH